VLELLAPARDARPHPGPQHPFQPGAVLGRRERLRGQRPSIHDAVRRYGLAEPGDHLIPNLRRVVQVVHHAIGRQDRGAEPLERVERGRLAGPYTSRQPDYGNGQADVSSAAVDPDSASDSLSAGSAGPASSAAASGSSAGRSGSSASP